MPRVLQAVVTEPKCRVCKSGQREAADRYLSLLGEELDGQRVTWDRLVGVTLPVLLGESISLSAAKRHRNKHCRWVEDDANGDGAAPAWEEDAEAQALLEHVDALLVSDRISPVALLELQQRIYLRSVQAKLRRGEELPPLTHDAAARAADKLIGSQRSAEQATLLEALGAGIGMVFEKALGPDQNHKETPAIIEGSVVAESDDDTEVSSGEPDALS